MMEHRIFIGFECVRCGLIQEGEVVAVKWPYRPPRFVHSGVCLSPVFPKFEVVEHKGWYSPENDGTHDPLFGRVVGRL